ARDAGPWRSAARAARDLQARRSYEVRRENLRRRVTDAEAGFTLVELLVALALMVVIAGLLVSAIVGARQALNVVDQRGTQASVPAVQSLLRQLLVEARGNRDAIVQANPDRAFVGAPDKLGFVSSFVPQGQYGGLWRYELALDASQRV